MISFFNNAMASYFQMHSKNFLRQFYFKGVLIIHREKNAIFTKYTNKYCPKMSG